MDITIQPQILNGKIRAIPSKSQAHRVLICAAFSEKSTNIICPETNQDIEATAQCLRALGANIERTSQGYYVTPCAYIPKKALLDCVESGSTLRFMLPIVAALGVDATFKMSGRLPHRPLSPLWEEMEAHGCELSRPTTDTIRCRGKLNSGVYTIDGGVSSQFITGLMFALALIPGENQLIVTGKVESRPYIEMTNEALVAFGINAFGNTIQGSYPFSSPGEFTIEGDWSNGAFFTAANAIGNAVDISGLSESSTQGDRQVINILNCLDSRITVDAADIPDLVPILAVSAGAKHGATFINIERLRLKESDRVATVSEMLQALGAETEVTDNALTVKPAVFRGCTIDAHGDHRIAMAAAIAATVATGPVTILGAQCVTKSYPSFWEEYTNLGGRYEQYIR